MIDGKHVTAMCHGQLYQHCVKRAFNKKVRPRVFEEGNLVLKKHNQAMPDHKGKFAPAYEGPYMVKNAFPRGALILANMDGNYNVLVSQKKEKKSRGQIFNGPHVPHLTPFPTTHFHSSLYSLSSSLSSFLFIFLFSLIHSSPLLYPLISTSPPLIFTHLFTLCLAHSLPFFSFFCFLSYIPFHSYILSLVLPHHYHHFHHNFLARSPENSCEPISTFTSFFWGKNF